MGVSRISSVSGHWNSGARARNVTWPWSATHSWTAVSGGEVPWTTPLAMQWRTQSEGCVRDDVASAV
jgi:hypothetical protein